MGFRNRSSALLDLDDMIGHIISGLESMSLFENTFFFFTAVSVLTFFVLTCSH